MSELPPAPARPVVRVRSAVDPWVLLALATGPVVALGVAVLAITADRRDEAVVMLGVAGLTTVLTLALVMPCRYTLLADALSIRCGLFHVTVAYDQIRGVELSRSWASGYGLSLRRLAIQTDRRRHLISPIDREAFAEQLRARLPPRPGGVRRPARVR